MGCAVSLPSVREDNDCAIRYSDKHTLETPDPKSQLTGSAEVTDLATKTLQTPESENFGNSLSESYKIRAEEPLHRTQRSSSDRASGTPTSARSTASLASTVQARGRASSSLPQTPAGLEDIDELQASGSKAALNQPGGQKSSAEVGIAVAGRSLNKPMTISHSLSSLTRNLGTEGTQPLAQAASHAASLSASGGKSLNNSGMLSDSIPGGSSIKVRAFSNLGPHAGKLPPLNRSRQQSVMDGEDALDKSIQPTPSGQLGQSTASFAGQWLPQSPKGKPPRVPSYATLDQLSGGAMGGLFASTRASLLKQDGFKKAAYLSTGSVDSRPTFQRDAVDDDATGSGLGLEGPNAISWKDMHLGRGPLQGAAYGSLVMPQFKGGRKADRQKKLPHIAPEVEVATSPMSVDMSAWEALSSTRDGPDMDAAVFGRDGAVGSEDGLGGSQAGYGDAEQRSRSESQLGSIAAWQAIAADVLDEGPEENEDSQGDDLEEALEAVGQEHAEDAAGEHRAAVLAKMSHRPETEEKTQIVSRAQGLFYVNYELQGKLGEGAFGEARLARRRKDGQIFVVKIMHGAQLTEKAKEEARNEVRVLASLNHPNIVRYYETFVDEKSGRLQIVMEYCEEGDLDSFLKSQNSVYLDEDAVLLKFVQICLGLQHVHSKGIIHRDLKGNNIFCCGGGILKLGDFGISKVLSPNARAARTMIGTPYYMSPEILKGRPYDGKTDIWAIGCILYELCSLKKAFDAGNLGAITVKVMSGKFQPIPSQYSDAMRSLVDALIKREPGDRPSLDEVLQLDIVRKGLVLYQDLLRDSKAQQQQNFEEMLQTGSLNPAGLSGDTNSQLPPGAEHNLSTQNPESLKAKRQAGEAAAKEVERQLEARRLAQLLQLRQLEDSFAQSNLARLRRRTTLKCLRIPEERMTLREDTATHLPDRALQAGSEESYSNTSATASNDSKHIREETTFSRAKEAPRRSASNERPNLEPYSPSRPTAERRSLLPGASSSCVNLLRGSSHSLYRSSEETDDVDPLQESQAFPVASLKGSVGLMSHIESVLQKPSLDTLPTPLEAT